MSRFCTQPSAPLANGQAQDSELDLLIKQLLALQGAPVAAGAAAGGGGHQFDAINARLFVCATQDVTNHHLAEGLKRDTKGV